ncbi:hypothetical protein [Planktothrix paucivesiculata]|jgi:hypothetical protein|uniref:hypothetical protein n=1 Tax=Planktothrix paucivesiculata TaxID=1678308 RepID=UPI0009F938ED|nr:hypothetical protein [Planktothrix paucivesiculata]
MLIPILIIDVALVAWSLHLMKQAVECKEFSFMLAGILVALSAAAMGLVYFLMGSCIDHIAQMSQHAYSYSYF